jgi:hypothetical protein
LIIVEACGYQISPTRGNDFNGGTIVLKTGLTSRTLPTPWFALDIEASGLQTQSFPLQIAWCDVQGISRCYLLKPSAKWDVESWDVNAETLHGISLFHAQQNGMDCVVVAKELNAHLQAMTVVSDGVAFDSNWLSMIFASAGIEPLFKIQDAYHWLGKCVWDQKLNPQAALDAIKDDEGCKGRNHNALDDAKLLMEALASVIEER